MTLIKAAISLRERRERETNHMRRSSSQANAATADAAGRFGCCCCCFSFRERNIIRKMESPRETGVNPAYLIL